MLKKLYSTVTFIGYHLICCFVVWKLLTVALPATLTPPITFTTIMALWGIMVVVMICFSVIFISLFRATEPEQKLIAEIKHKDLQE